MFERTPHKPTSIQVRPHRWRPGVEQLEDRLTPAAATLSSGVLAIDFTATGATAENVNVSNDGTNITLSGDITGASSSPVGSVSRIQVSDSGGGTAQSITFAGTAAFLLSNGLVSTGVDTVTINNAIGVLGGSTLSLTAPRNIAVNAGLGTVSGALSLSANQGETAVGGSFTGIVVNGTTLSSTLGNITLAGRGGATGTDQVGVHLLGGAVVGSGTGGAVSVQGSGGASTGGASDGVRLAGASTRITSGGGAVSVTGVGGGSAGSNLHFGVNVSGGAAITAGGTANVTVNGTGGGGDSFNYGVYVVGANSRITSTGGNVSVTGHGGGGGTGSLNVGVRLESGGSISAGLTGTVTVEGTGGEGTGGANHGVSILLDGARITSDGGAVGVTGTGGGANSEFNYGVHVADTGRISAGLQGTVTVVGQGGCPSGNGGGNDGVNVVGAASEIGSNDGNVAVTGTGGGSGSGDQNVGVRVGSGGQIAAGGDGAVTVLGTAGTADGVFNIGVWVLQEDARITSNNGNVVVTGSGAVSTVGGLNTGVDVVQATVSAGGTGSVHVTGTGGAGPDGSQYGVRVGPSGLITSNDGAVSVNGTGGVGASGQNIGVGVGGGKIVAGGSGAVTVIGAGGSGGGFNYGVDVRSQLSSIDGNVTVTGTGGVGDFSDGVIVATFGFIAAGPGNDLTLNATAGTMGADLDDLTLASGGFLFTSEGGSITAHFDSLFLASNSFINGGTGTVTLVPSAGTAITFGSGSSPGTLGLSDVDVLGILGSTLIFGDAQTGPITVSGAIELAGQADVELHSAAAIVFDAGTLDIKGGDLLLDPGTGGVQPRTNGTEITAGTVSFASDLTINVGAGSDQLTVAGMVNLTGVGLVLTGTFVPQNPVVFTIVSATSVTNKFTALNEGGLVDSNGAHLAIHYTTTAVTLATPLPALAAGTGKGTPEVAVYDAAHQELARFNAFPTGAGGVRVALGDVTGDGVADIVAGAGTKRQSFVRVLDGITFQPLAGVRGEFRVFGKQYQGGVFVATGLIDGDANADIIVGKGAGAATVKLYSGLDGSLLRTIQAGTQGGARVAAADLTNDGTAEVIVATGSGVTGKVKTYNAAGQRLASFVAFTKSYQGGVYVAAGDVNNDGVAEILVGRGKGTSSVRLLTNNGGLLRETVAFETAFAGGVRVAMLDGDGDGQIDQLLAAGGDGRPPELRRFDLDLAALDSFFAFDQELMDGLFIGGIN